ncbi:MAG: MOSC domain-containing protein, partial [Pseudomonadota bacterium]
AKIIGIARRSARREPMEEIKAGSISIDAGLQGDFKGAKHKTRQITILAEEDWNAALADLPDGTQALHWTTRRANILTSGLRLPRVEGAKLAIGDVELEVTGQTWPCKRMDEAFPGLLKALGPEWRGGVTCSVLKGGDIALEDSIEITHAPEERVRKLPG